jgi:hypothetical protein
MPSLLSQKLKKQLRSVMPAAQKSGRDTTKAKTTRKVGVPWPAKVREGVINELRERPYVAVAVIAELHGVPPETARGWARSEGLMRGRAARVRANRDARKGGGYSVDLTEAGIVAKTNNELLRCWPRSRTKFGTFLRRTFRHGHK